MALKDYVWLILLTAHALAAGEAAWVSLFDGKTTQGWVEVTGKPFPLESWKLEDGCLKAFPNDIKGQQDLRTVGLYRYYELEWEWKLEAIGNSGVKYLLGRIDEWTPKGSTTRQARARGLEYQLADDANPDAIEPKRYCSALYSAIAPSPKLPCAPDVFHTSRIVVRQDRIEHWLDGTKVASFAPTDPEVMKVRQTNAPKVGQAGFADGRSPVALQNHGSIAWFRKIRIREL